MASGRLQADDVYCFMLLIAIDCVNDSRVDVVVVIKGRVHTLSYNVNVHPAAGEIPRNRDATIVGGNKAARAYKAVDY